MPSGSEGFTLSPSPLHCPPRLWDVASSSEKRLENDIKENWCSTRGRPHVIAMKTPGRSNCFPGPAGAMARLRPSRNQEPRDRRSPPRASHQGLSVKSLPRASFSDEATLPSIKTTQARLRLDHHAPASPQTRPTPFKRNLPRTHTRWSREFREGQTLMRLGFLKRPLWFLIIRESGRLRRRTPPPRSPFVPCQGP